MQAVIYAWSECFCVFFFFKLSADVEFSIGALCGIMIFNRIMMYTVDASLQWLPRGGFISVGTTLSQLPISLLCFVISLFFLWAVFRIHKLWYHVSSALCIACIVHGFNGHLDHCYCQWGWLTTFAYDSWFIVMCSNVFSQLPLCFPGVNNKAGLGSAWDRFRPIDRTVTCQVHYGFHALIMQICFYAFQI